MGWPAENCAAPTYFGAFFMKAKGKTPLHRVAVLLTSMFNNSLGALHFHINPPGDALAFVSNQQMCFLSEPSRMQVVGVRGAGLVPHAEERSFRRRIDDHVRKLARANQGYSYA